MSTVPGDGWPLLISRHLGREGRERGKGGDEGKGDGKWGETRLREKSDVKGGKVKREGRKGSLKRYMRKEEKVEMKDMKGEEEMKI